MRRKLIVLFTVIMLAIGMIAVSSSAFTTTYITTTKTKIATIHNTTASEKSAYGILFASGGTAKLELCDINGYIVYASGMYPAGSTDPHRTRCSIPTGGYRYVFVKPVPSGTQIWGNAEYGIE